MEGTYKVKLDVFEGPLDLLLYLVKKDEIDIYDISIERITKQYLETLETLQLLNIELAGEFIVMAAHLLYIKSRLLLPVDQQSIDEEQEEEDPRWDLIRQLIEYKKYKEASAELGELEVVESDRFRRKLETDAQALPVEENLLLKEISTFDLIRALQNLLKRRANEKGTLREIFDESFSVSDKMEYLLRATTPGILVRFDEVFSKEASRAEIIVTFLAILELTRMKHLRCRQENAFDEIWIERIENEQAFITAQEEVAFSA